MDVFCGKLQGRSNGSPVTSESSDSDGVRIGNYERLSESSRLIPHGSSDDHQHNFRRNSAWTSVLKAFFAFKKALNNNANAAEPKRRSSWIPDPHDRRWPVQGW